VDTGESTLTLMRVKARRMGVNVAFVRAAHSLRAVVGRCRRSALKT
jgi:hypothetical protein